MAAFDEIRRDAPAMTAACCSALQRIGRNAESDTVRDARNQLLDGRLTAVTIGGYKRGKSSLVGALVEDSALFPVNVDIATSLITSIEYAAEERITIFLGQEESSAPQWISRDQIADFVTEQGNPGNKRAARLLRIQTPNERLKDGLVLLDTPGAGGLNAAHTAVTYAVLSSADVGIFVIDALTPLTAQELSMLATAARLGALMIVVITKIDRVVDYDSAVSNAKVKLTGVLGPVVGASIPVIPVSSSAKPDWLRTGDPDLLSDSNFEALDAAIWSLLGQQGGVLLLGRALSRTITTLKDVITVREAELVGLSSEDPDARLFWLAGRARPVAPGPGIVAESARRWLGQRAYGWRAAAVIRRDQGWAVPDAFADSLTGLRATLTGRAVPGVVLAPGAAPDDWSASAPTGRSAWGMAHEYPGAEQATVAVGTADGNVAALRAGADTAPRTVLRLGSLVTAVAPTAAGRGVGFLAGSVLGEAGWVMGPDMGLVSLPRHTGRVSAVAANPRTLLSLGSDGRLHRIRLGGGPDLPGPDIVELGPSGASVLAVAERAPVAVAGGADGILRVLDAENLDWADARLGARNTALSLDADGRLAVVGHGDGRVTVVRLSDGTSRERFVGADPPAGPLAVSHYAASATVVAADATGLLVAWSGGLFSGAGSTARLGRHVGAVRHLGTTSVLAVGRRDGVVRVWSLPGQNRDVRSTTGEV